MVYVNILLFILGLVFVVKGSNYFIKSTASIAKKLGVSEFVIGLTLVALGTSLPEFVSAVAASIKHESGLIMGNIIGANIANIGLVIGVAAIIALIKTNKKMLEKDGYIMLFSALLLFAFISNKRISKIEGLVFLLLYVAYITFLFETKPEFKGKYRFREFTRYFFKFQYLITIKSRIFGFRYKKEISPAEKREIKELFKAGLVRDFLIVILAGFAVVFGANYMVEEAIFFAGLFKIPQTIIGIFIAIGTTMPEMSVAIAATRKGYGNIIVGNALGSIITNTLLILGVSALIYPLSVIKLTLYYIAPFMIIINILFLMFIKSDWKLTRIEGISFIILYAIFMLLLLFGGAI